MFRGAHPWYWESFNADSLVSALSEDAELGVGEIGLDRLRSKEIPLGMRSVFEAQLEIAARFGRKTVLHGAKCWGEVVKACSRYAGSIPAFIFHGFSRSGGLADEIVRIGGWFTVSPALLNDHAVNYRRLVVSLPIERLLVESDATAENVKVLPSVEIIAAKLAELKGMNQVVLFDRIEANAEEFMRAGR